MIDSARDHPTIVEVLAAFVREHSPATPPRSDAGGGQPGQHPVPETDVQAVLTVLGRRPSGRAERGMLYLTGADLSGANLRQADLSGASLSGARLVAGTLTGEQRSVVGTLLLALGAYLGAQLDADHPSAHHARLAAAAVYTYQATADALHVHKCPPRNGGVCKLHQPT
jgi:hypothetical protein